MENFCGLTAEHVFVTFSGFWRAAYKSRFVVLGSAPCPAEVCMTSTASCTCFPRPLVHRHPFIYPSSKAVSRLWSPLMKATYFGSIYIVWSSSVSLHVFSTLSPVVFVLPFKTDLSFSWLLFLSVTALGAATSLAQHRVKFIHQIRRHHALPA